MKITTFSPDYITARQRFREAACKLNWQQQALPIGQTGPNGEELTIDIAISSHENPENVLVISSGMHGVEGFFGSAIQLALMEHWAMTKQPPVKCVFIHCLNPYGMAWLRRVNEDNVDPNRNFLLPDEKFSGIPKGYTQLNDFLNPTHSPSNLPIFYPKMIALTARYGLPAIRQAVAAGQYEFPDGLFFGGKKPCRMQQLLLEHLPQWLAGNKHVIHLDFHTGLGAFGACKLLLDTPLTASQAYWMSQAFGHYNFELCNADGISYVSRGDLGRWCIAHQFSPDYLFICAEFGTYHPLPMLNGLRQENYVHRQGEQTTAAKQAKEHLKELFCPKSERWRQKVLEKSLFLVEQTIQGLTAPTEKKPAIK